jgi:predicted deacylase
MDESLVSRSRQKKAMRFSVTADADGTFVAAQELLTLPWYDAWLDELGQHPDLTVTEIGRSVEGRPIRMARSADRKEFVILLGRQHPGEVPGAIAMRDFVDVVLGDSELATHFRERYALLIVPLMNPDGVVNGHARHNAGETDLNRDWGPFTQPETAGFASVLDELDAAGLRPKLMLDFHATRMTPTMIFYTQIPEDDTDPPLFATHWLDRVDARIDDYEFTPAPRRVGTQPNAKNYFFRRYGIPSITYEIGDEADREAIHRYTPVFAEEMMKVMLEAD